MKNGRRIGFRNHGSSYRDCVAVIVRAAGECGIIWGIPAKHEYHVDFDDWAGRVERAAWIYDDPEIGWEHVKGRYGFYAGVAAAKFGKTKDTLE